MTREEHLLNLYAQHNAGMQKLISEAIDTIIAYQTGNSGDPEQELDDLLEDLENERTSWQAQDTWGKGYKDEVILDFPCDVCKGTGSVLNPDSGTGELCLKCFGARDLHQHVKLPLVMIYVEGEVVQNIVTSDNSINVMVLDQDNDEMASDTYDHIISQLDMEEIY